MPENHNENLPLKENGIAGEEAMETTIVKPRRKWTNYQKLHLAVTLVLLAICIALVALIGFYVVELDSTKAGDNKSNKMTLKKPVCESPECVAIAAQVLTYADHTIDPCVNFYDYACAGWAKQRYIPDSKPTWDTFYDLIDANDKLLKKKLVSGVPNKNSPAEVQLYKLYSSCLNTSSIDAAGLKPFKDLIASMGLNQNFNNSSWDLTESLVKIHSIFASVFMETGAPLFDVRVVVDIKNSTKPIVKVSIFVAVSFGPQFIIK